MKNKNIYIGPNTILDSDSYKCVHNKFYPKDLQIVYSYFECRLGAKFPKIKFFGLQYILSQLSEGFTIEEVNETFEITSQHGTAINKQAWTNMFNATGGKLPILIRAVPEGIVLPPGMPLFTIENTDDRFPWITNYIETPLSRVWYPIAVATLSYTTKLVLKEYLEKTSDDCGILEFQLHDFGSRGTTCREQAGIGGMAHLTNFLGTDTMIGMKYARIFYDAPKVCGYSVDATEHSVMTSRGKRGEKRVFKQCLDEVPTGILSMVIDSYDYQNFISKYAYEYKDIILGRNGKVVFRPDSGDPVKVSLDVFNRLWEVFGGTINSKGYKVLNHRVGMLWGDGIDLSGIRMILDAFVENKISTCNIVFGMGGGLLQKVNRDTNRCAIKCSAQKQNNIWKDIFKNPIDKSKISKKGKIGIIIKDGVPVCIRQDDPEYSPEKDLLQPVFLNGEILKTWTWEEVKANGLIFK